MTGGPDGAERRAVTSTIPGECGRSSGPLLLLLADRVIDGTGRPPIEPGFVAIEGDRVAAVGAPAALPARLRPATERLDFAGCTILPGLVDSHVHLTFSAGAFPFRDLQSDTDGRLLLRAAANAREALQAGVTTVRDLGGRDRTALELRDAINERILPGPRVLAAGRPITCPGGHCHFLGGVARGVGAVTALARQLVGEGVDVLKVMATGGNMTETSDPLTPQFSSDELQAIVEVAENAGLRVTAHARGVAGIHAAVLAGVHGIEHCRMEVAPGRWAFDEGLARRMADRGVFVAPTLAASFRAFQRQAAGGAVGLRPGAIPFSIRQQNARRLRAAGVRVVVGTDAGAALARFEEAVHVELESLVGAGWTPVEAIEAGTRAAATAIGLADRLGSLAPGLLADVAVVRGNPAESISAVRQVERVYQNGCLVAVRGQLVQDARPTPYPPDGRRSPRDER
ncbi:MAG: amidohydrolase family protein [Candidatus Rokuibacteriota bacterium]